MPLIKTKLGACITSLLICATFYQLTAQSQFRYEKLTSDDGLPSNSINAIMQDSFGFIWIGTGNGLCRYDGNEIKTYLPLLNDPTSISGSFIISLYEDKRGNIWVGTLSNGLNVFDRKTESFRRFIHNPDDSTSLSDNSFLGVQLMLEDHAGNFWVGTDNGINLFDRSTNTFRELPIGTELHGNIPTTGMLRERADERAAKRIRGIYQDRHQNLWVGTDWGGLYRYDYSSKKFVGYFPDPDNAESISFTTPGDFLEDESGNMWILNYWNGLDKLDLKTGKFQQLPNDPDDPLSLSANRPLTNFIIDGNIIWIGTSTGLCTFNTKQNTLEQFIPINSDFEGYICPLLKDKQGNYWFSTGSGLLIINNIHQGFQKYVHQDDNSKSISRESTSIGVDSKGVVYINQPNGVDILNERKEKVRSVSVAPESSDPRLAQDLNCILETSAGNMLFVGAKVCQFKSGIQYLEDVYPEADYPTHGHTRDVLEDSDYNIWYAGHCLSSYDPKYGSFDYYYPKGQGNFASNNIYSLLEAGPSQILLGGVWDGLILFDTKQKKFIKEFPISNQNILNGSTATIHKIFRSQDQKIWVGSNYGLSLFDIEKETFHPYGIKEGLPSNVVYNIVEDGHHNLWLATSNGLSKFDPKTESFRNYDQRDGLAGNEFYFGHTAFNHPTTGELWFLGPEGLTVFNPDSLRDNTYIPPVIFTKCIHYNRKKNNGQPIIDNTVHNKNLVRFSYSDNIIEFHFAALNFISPEKNKYAYRLIGFNDEWVNLGHRHEVSFTNLNPGKYTLQVKASNNDDIWNEEGRSILIIITPPWWLTWWAYSVYAVGLLFFIWRLHKMQKARTLRIERERTQAKELEQAKEIEKAYAQLETAHENLKATQKQLIQSEKMASLGELTAGIAHEIQNPLNFVNNFSEVSNELIVEMREELDKGDIEEAKSIATNIEQNLQKIHHHGKRADGIVKGMLQHSRSGSGEKELTNINALADEYFRLAYHGLRAKDKSFNAAMETDFDDSIPLINIVPQDIGRVILNLITNAFYAVSTPKSPSASALGLWPSRKGDLPYEPTVIVKTKLLKPPFREGRSPQAKDPGRLGADHIEISIQDNGNGIPDEIKDKIFQPFFTTKPTGQGTGLGLSMSYDIIKAHGGEIKVETKEGEGSEFVITLPI